MALSNINDLYIIRKEIPTSAPGVENFDLVVINLNTGNISNVIPFNVGVDKSDNPYEIVAGTFKCLQDDVQGPYILFTCQRTDNTGKYHIFLFNISTGGGPMGHAILLNHLAEYVLWDKTCFTSYDINGLVFVYIKETDTLLTFTVYPGEVYVDGQAKLLSHTSYGVESIFSTSYNGILYYTLKEKSGESRRICSYDVRKADYENPRVEHTASLYTDNRRIRFIDSNSSEGDRSNDKIYAHTDPSVVVDYAGTEYYCKPGQNSNDMIDIWFKPVNGSPDKITTLPRDIEDSPFSIANFSNNPVPPSDFPQMFQYSFYNAGGKDSSNADLGDKAVFLTVKNNLKTPAPARDYFQFIGIAVDISGHDDNEYIYLYPDRDRDSSYSINPGSLSGIGGTCVKVLPFNHLTSRYVIQPVVYIKHRQPFYDINDVLKVQYVLDIPSDRSRKAEVTVTLRRGAVVMNGFPDTFIVNDPNPNTVREYVFDKIPPTFTKEVGIYSVRMTAKVKVNPGEPDTVVINPSG